MADLAARFPTFVRIARPVAAAARWWLAEMAALLAGVAGGRSMPLVALAADGALPADLPPAGRAVELRLPAAWALAKTVTLPAAAEANLREVLAFEMDRETPFRAADVHVHARVAGRAGRQIRVALVVVPRAMAARAVAAVSGRGLAVERLSVEAPDGIADLSDPADRPPRRRGSRLLPLLAGGLALAVLAVPPLLNVWRAGRLDARIDALGERAALALRLQEELERRRGAASDLDARKAAAPLALAVVAELSARLPDGVWLDELRLAAGEAHLTGYAPAAAELIALLDASPLLEGVRFETAVVQDPVRRRERFRIAAALTGGGAR
ncbi:PilN domain-containing protein [Azospirillum sp. ST 5-10]|uniref:PilN domain-containing protein n=1 Tax=unclassified Azospirillum TaxID=2630922 RepID=UPI003F4A015F